jgi:putative ubiquitin-RnfH superfamily antitoxin RatB of RatAB toxin-antitoxin module
MIKANESRTVKFDKALKSGDKIEAILGYYIVNPKVVKKLGLEDEKELSKFTTLKTTYFEVK